MTTLPDDPLFLEAVPDPRLRAATAALWPYREAPSKMDQGAAQIAIEARVIEARRILAVVDAAREFDRGVWGNWESTTVSNLTSERREYEIEPGINKRHAMVREGSRCWGCFIRGINGETFTLSVVVPAGMPEPARAAPVARRPDHDRGGGMMRTEEERKTTMTLSRKNELARWLDACDFDAYEEHELDAAYQALVDGAWPDQPERDHFRAIRDQLGRMVWVAEDLDQLDHPCPAATLRDAVERITAELDRMQGSPKP